MGDHYRLVFDLGRLELEPSLSLWFALAMLLATPILWAARWRAMAVVIFVAMAGIGGWVVYRDVTRFNADQAQIRAGKVPVVEGCLERFHPMRFEGHEDERLVVQGHTFAYSDYDESGPGFNRSESHGGPVHRDSRVRIGYIGEDIVRLEVIDHACPPAPDAGP